MDYNKILDTKVENYKNKDIINNFIVSISRELESSKEMKKFFSNFSSMNLFEFYKNTYEFQRFLDDLNLEELFKFKNELIEKAEYVKSSMEDVARAILYKSINDFLNFLLPLFNNQIETISKIEFKNAKNTQLIIFKSEATGDEILLKIKDSNINHFLSSLEFEELRKLYVDIYDESFLIAEVYNEKFDNETKFAIEEKFKTMCDLATMIIYEYGL